jgi:hypothetical protein
MFQSEGPCITKFFSLKLSDSNFILRNNKEVDLFEETRYPQLSNCDICSNQNILFMTGLKQYEIWPRPKGWVQKIFRTLPPNFVKCLNESWLKCCPFCMDGKWANWIQRSINAQRDLFLPTIIIEVIYDEILIVSLAEYNNDSQHNMNFSPEGPGRIHNSSFFITYEWAK